MAKSPDDEPLTPDEDAPAAEAGAEDAVDAGDEVEAADAEPEASEPAAEAEAADEPSEPESDEPSEPESDEPSEPESDEPSEPETSEPEPVGAVAEEALAQATAADEEPEPYRDLVVFDNPSVGRALRYTFAEKRLARAVFVNALLLVAALGAVQEIYGRQQLALFSNELTLGRLAFLAVVAVESLVISVLAPLGSMLLFEAERREECFDQVVASGVSPHRVIYGRWLATLAFLAVVIGSSLPFFAAVLTLEGATFGQVVTALTVLSGYGVCLASLSLALAVAWDDVALPGLLAGMGCLTTAGLALSYRLPPTLTAWSPLRHLTVASNDIAADLQLRGWPAPTPFGVEVETAYLSLLFYFALGTIALLYAYVGPDVELDAGMDSFDSVATSPDQEVRRARRGAARALLRAVQVRFFYENLNARAQALTPLIRVAVALAFFCSLHVVVLGSLWPDAPPASFRIGGRRFFYPYLSFCALSLGLLGLSGAGARSALLARHPVTLFTLGTTRIAISRFAATLVVFVLGVCFPPALWFGATWFTGFPEALANASELRGIYLLFAEYAAFMFALSLVFATRTSNPYSATARTLTALFAVNLVPALWILLFRANLAGEGSAFLLDVSPASACFSIARPGVSFPFSTEVAGEKIYYDHVPSWVPCAIFHGVLGTIALVIGLLGARRVRASRHDGEGAA